MTSIDTASQQAETRRGNPREAGMKDLIRANFGLLAAGIATFIMMGAGQSLYGPALPSFARDLNLTMAAAAWLVSAHWIGCAIGVGFMYFRGAHVVPRHVIAAMALGAAIVAIGPGRIGPFAGALIFGAGYGAATVVFNPRILRAFGERGTAMLSLLNASFGIGAIAIPLIFVGLGSDTSLTFGLVAVLAVVIWLGAGPAGRTGSAAPDQAEGSYSPRLALQLFAVVGIGIEACLIGLGPTALIDLGLTETEAAQHLSAFFAAFLGARVGLVMVAHLVAPFTLYIGAMLFTVICLSLGLASAPGPFFVILGLAAGLYFPSFYVSASKVMGDHPKTPATIIAAGLVGGIFAPILLGSLMDEIGGRGLFLTLILSALGAAIAGLIVRRYLPGLRGSGRLGL